MDEKNKKDSNGEDQKESQSKKNSENRGEVENTVVLKTDLHCEGCASKLIKFIRSFDGVESAMVAGGQKITVVGSMDAAKLREWVEQKTNKKVELISPLPNNKSQNDNPKQEKKIESKDKNGKDKNKPDEKKTKEKEPPVTTAVFKVYLHCEGCMHKIYKIVSKTKGFEDLIIDKQKDLVTVRGAMDMKALAEVLKKNLKRDVQIVPPKKESDKKVDGGGVKPETNSVQLQHGYHPYPTFAQNTDGVGSYAYTASMFSDENPNSCSVM